jgi:hypothetical protein
MVMRGLQMPAVLPEEVTEPSITFTDWPEAAETGSAS